MTSRAATRRDRRWVENRPHAGWLPRIDIRDLLEHREVGLILAERDLRARYRQTLLGVAWVVIQPLLALVVFTLVLGEGVGVPSEGVPYAAFAIVGLAVWFPFSAALSRATNTLINDTDLVTKVYFPRLLAPLGALLATLVDLLVALVIAVVVVVATGVPLRPELALLLLIPVAFGLVSLGFGLWLSALNVLYRDVGHGLGYGLQMLFFVTPVVYPVTLLGEPWQTVLALNPVAALIDAARWMALGTPLELERLAVAGAFTVVLLATGLTFFSRIERRFADRI